MRNEIKVLLGIAAVVIMAAVIGSSYYRSSKQSERKAIPAINNRLVREDSPTLGGPDAKVTLVEFLDPEREGYRQFSPTVEQLNGFSPTV